MNYNILKQLPKDMLIKLIVNLEEQIKEDKEKSTKWIIIIYDEMWGHNSGYFPYIVDGMKGSEKDLHNIFANFLINNIEYPLDSFIYHLVSIYDKEYFNKNRDEFDSEWWCNEEIENYVKSKLKEWIIQKNNDLKEERITFLDWVESIEVGCGGIKIIKDNSDAIQSLQDIDCCPW